MSIALNRSTREVRNSVPTTDYLNDPDWLIIKCSPLKIDKKLPTCEVKYWKIIDDEVVEMTADEKKVVDGKEKAKTEKATAKAERERLIAERSYKIAEDQLIAEGVIKKEVSSI